MEQPKREELIRKTVTIDDRKPQLKIEIPNVTASINQGMDYDFEEHQIFEEQKNFAHNA